MVVDKEEFCDNVRQCERAMYTLAYSIVKNEADAGEIISESIFRAYKNINSLKKKESFKPWMLKIVHNTAVEMIRKNAKITTSDDTDRSVQEGHENNTTTRLIIREAISGLKQPYRTVVILFYYENFSITDIAKITGTNIIAVKQQLSRARKMLKEVLKEEFYEK